MYRTVCVFALLRVFVLLVVLAGKPAAANELAQQAFEVLNSRCFGCHGQRFSVPDFNIRDHEGLLAETNAYIVPGKPEESVLW